MQKNKKSKFHLWYLTSGAMLTALSIVIGIFCKNYLNFGNGLFRITFENFPIILSGIMFGPAIGTFVGIASDILSYVLSTQSFAISPIVTLGAASVGFVSGLVSHYIIRKDSFWRIALSAFAAHFVGSVIIKSTGLFVYYGIAVLWRIPLYAVIASLEIFLLYLLFKHNFFHSMMNLNKEKK